MKEKSRRFQILFSELEFEVLRKEAEKRNISSAELIRYSLQNELQLHSSYDRLMALRGLFELEIL
ncbi:MAG: CopG family transcriptional regulator [Leptospiraceae bacterium]|nr:CopG family transcriptional regulator [Leptospiraceae bacterium]MCP5500739.1 CopG family transcriptional regulator [Leptospiraceae bacterium]